LQAAVAAQHFIVIAGDVNNPGTIAHHVDYFFYHNQVGRWEIAFIEIPDVNKIAVEDQQSGLNTTQVHDQFRCMASIGSEMYITDYDNIQVSFLHCESFSKFQTRCNLIISESLP
jgi:hypothetical protein